MSKSDLEHCPFFRNATRIRVQVRHSDRIARGCSHSDFFLHVVYSIRIPVTRKRILHGSPQKGTCAEEKVMISHASARDRTFAFPNLFISAGTSGISGATESSFARLRPDGSFFAVACQSLSPPPPLAVRKALVCQGSSHGSLSPMAMLWPFHGKAAKNPHHPPSLPLTSPRLLLYRSSRGSSRTTLTTFAQILA